MRHTQYNNLAELFACTVKQFAKNPAFSCLGKTLNFKEVDVKANALAGFFAHIGLVAGDRIVIQLPNLLQYPVAAYAAFKVGLVIVNTNPLYTSKEMRHQFRDSGAKAIIILDSLYPKLQKIQAETQIEHVIVTAVSDFLTAEMTSIDADVTPLLTALEIGQACDYMPSPANQDDLALLQYTGGTTGVSKGAQLTHNNLLTNAWQSGERLAGHCKAGQETFICPLPLYHIYAFTLNMVLFASQGNLNVLIPNPRDLDAFVDAIKAYTMTGFAGLNTLFVGLC